MEGSIAFVDTAFDGGDFEAYPSTTQSLYRDMAIFLQNKLTEKYMEAYGKEFPHGSFKIYFGLMKIRDDNLSITEKLTGLYNGIVRPGSDEAWYNEDVENFLLVRVLLYMKFNSDQIEDILHNHNAKALADDIDMNGNFGITPNERYKMEYLA